MGTVLSFTLETVMHIYILHIYNTFSDVFFEKYVVLDFSHKLKIDPTFEKYEA